MPDPSPTEPVPVALVSVPPELSAAATAASQNPSKVQSQKLDPSAPATTTFQQDLIAAGQRNINVMWEGTQKNIALMVVVMTLVVLGYVVVSPKVTPELQLVALSTLSNVLFAVTSVYFTRTNHTKTGGVGSGETGR